MYRRIFTCAADVEDAVEHAHPAGSTSESRIDILREVDNLHRLWNSSGYLGARDQVRQVQLLYTSRKYAYSK